MSRAAVSKEKTPGCWATGFTEPNSRPPFTRSPCLSVRSACSAANAFAPSTAPASNGAPSPRHVPQDDSRTLGLGPASRGVDLFAPVVDLRRLSDVLQEHLNLLLAKLL